MKDKEALNVMETRWLYSTNECKLYSFYPFDASSVPAQTPLCTGKSCWNQRNSLHRSYSVWDLNYSFIEN